MYNTGEEPIFSKNGLLTTVAYKLGKDAPVVYALEVSRVKQKSQIYPRGRGLGFDLDGDVPPEPRNPYPFLRVIFAKKGTHF